MSKSEDKKPRKAAMIVIGLILAGVFSLGYYTSELLRG